MIPKCRLIVSYNFQSIKSPFSIHLFDFNLFLFVPWTLFNVACLYISFNCNRNLCEFFIYANFHMHNFPTFSYNSREEKIKSFSFCKLQFGQNHEKKKKNLIFFCFLSFMPYKKQSFVYNHFHNAYIRETDTEIELIRPWCVTDQIENKQGNCL